MNIITVRRPRPKTNFNRLSIQVFSRLVNRPAQAWEAVFRELEKSREVMLAMYAPLRSAINHELKYPGSGARRLERMLRNFGSSPSSMTVKQKSRAAFQVFKVELLPSIEKILEDYVDDVSGTKTIPLDGLRLFGSFHFKALMKDGTTKLVYAHASDWDEGQTKVFVELLAMLAEAGYGMSREAVLFLDLNVGKVRTVSSTYKRMREFIRTAAKHFVRIKDTLHKN